MDNRRIVYQMSPGYESKRQSLVPDQVDWQATTWRQRFGLWLIRKLNLIGGLYFYVRDIHYKTIEIDTTNVLEQLELSVREMGQVYRGQVSAILVSHKVLREVKRDSHLRNPLWIQTRCDMFGELGRKIIGLDVCVVPWMEDGYLILTKDIFERLIPEQSND